MAKMTLADKLEAHLSVGREEAILTKQLSSSLWFILTCHRELVWLDYCELGRITLLEIKRSAIIGNHYRHRYWTLCITGLLCFSRGWGLFPYYSGARF